MDDLDRQLLSTLAGDARMTLKALATAVDLSSPSVADRLRRLEDEHIISAYTIDVAPEALGYGVQAIVHIKPLPGKLHIVERLVRDTPQIVECDKVTGDDCFIARVCAVSMAHLDGILSGIAEKAETKTSVVKNQTVKRRLPPLDALCGMTRDEPTSRT